MKPGFPLIGLFSLLVCLFIINSCDLNHDGPSDQELLIGEWKTLTFQVDGEERLNATFSSVTMRYELEGSAAWLFTGLNGHKESVTGVYALDKGKSNSVLKFIDPEFSLVVTDTLYLSGISEANKEYFIKAVKR